MERIQLIKLVEQANQHDQKAIEELYRITYSIMYSLAMTLCENHTDAEDILQESYIRAFSKLDTLSEKAAFINWMKKIVVNVWRNYHNSKSPILEINISDTSEASLLWCKHQDSLTDMMEQAEVNRELRAIVDRLPENQRICMLLFYYENMRIEEIADVLDIPVGSVKSRLHYGRKAVEKGLKNRGLFSGGQLTVPQATVGAEAADSALLAKILAALQTAANGGSAVSAGGIALKLGLGLASLLAIGGLIGIPVLMNTNNNENPEPTQPSVTTHSTTAMTSTTTSSATIATTSSTTVTTTATSTTATTPKPYVSFAFEDYDGGIKLTSYTGTEPDVTIPDSIDGKTVTAVGSGAFKNSRILRSVTIPSSVRSIDSNAFRECRALQSVSLGNGVSYIGDMAFLGCSSLHSVNIPSNVHEISIYAFAYCVKLEQVSINEGTKIIGYCAFAHCPKLQSVYLPASVVNIGGDTFEGASDMLVLSVPENSYSLDYAAENGFTYIISQ